MNNLMYHEIFELFEKTEKRSDKIEVLRKNADNNFVQFLIMSFNPNVKFDVEIPEYKSSVDPAGLNILYLHNEVTKMYRFIVDHPRRAAGLTQEKQKSLLTSVLEALHKDEASLLVRCIQKDLKIPFLTKKLVREAFPDIDLGEK
jgi:hypothetical protein